MPSPTQILWRDSRSACVVSTEASSAWAIQSPPSFAGAAAAPPAPAAPALAGARLAIKSLGARVVKQRADAGDREAQFSLGCYLVAQAAEGDGGLLGAAGRSPKALAAERSDPRS